MSIFLKNKKRYSLPTFKHITSKEIIVYSLQLRETVCFLSDSELHILFD